MNKLKVSENTVLRKMFEPKRSEVGQDRDVRITLRWTIER
jgi:hypothetical protein